MYFLYWNFISLINCTVSYILHFFIFPCIECYILSLRLHYIMHLHILYLVQHKFLLRTYGVPILWLLLTFCRCKSDSANSILSFIIIYRKYDPLLPTSAHRTTANWVSEKLLECAETNLGPPGAPRPRTAYNVRTEPRSPRPCLQLHYRLDLEV